MNAQHATTCRGCRGAIAPGDEMTFTREEGARHPRCRTARKPKPTDAERAWQFKPGLSARQLEEICT